MERMIAVVGPTASGKSSLALEVAKSYSGEIVSCDSMQLYRNMDIGTAKPTKDEMKSVKHHLIDILNLNQDYSVSDYVRDAEIAYNDIISRGKLPVFCGGTGLYIDSFISGVKFAQYETEGFEEIRNKLYEIAQNNGKEYLHQELLKIDPEIANNTSPENVKRVIRALEVYKITGITLSEWNKRSMENVQKKNALIIGINFEDRQDLYDRIEKRVDIMLKDGILDETKRLIDMGIKDSKTASQAIGYKEFYPYFDGIKTIDECIEALKINTRHYAKRQLTWFKRNPDIKWITRDKCDTEQTVIEKAFALVDEFLTEV